MIPGWPYQKWLNVFDWLHINVTGSKIMFSKCNFHKSSCLKVQGPEFSYLMYNIILRSSINIWWTTLVVLCKWLYCDLWCFPLVSHPGHFWPSCFHSCLSFVIYNDTLLEKHPWWVYINFNTLNMWWWGVATCSPYKRSFRAFLRFALTALSVRLWIILVISWYRIKYQSTKSCDFENIFVRFKSMNLNKSNYASAGAPLIQLA